MIVAFSSVFPYSLQRLAVEATRNSILFSLYYAVRGASGDRGAKLIIADAKLSPNSCLVCSSLSRVSVWIAIHFSQSVPLANNAVTALPEHLLSPDSAPVHNPNLRSTQPCICPGSLNRVPASAGVRAGMSPLPGGR